MSSIEEQLRRDIATITGGVVVTESDLWEARAAVAERIDSRNQQGRRRRTVAAVAAAAVVVPVLGFVALQTLDSPEKTAPPVSPVPSSAVSPSSPSTEDPFLVGDDPTRQLVEGVWREDNGINLLLFGADGSLRVDSDGGLFSQPALIGTYVIDGDLISVTTTGGKRSACAGKEFALRASLPSFGAMRFHAQSTAAGCFPMQPGERWELEQVLPTNGSLRGFTITARGNWLPPTERSTLYGDWMAEVASLRPGENVATGNVLELGRDGSYTVAAERGGVVDRGRWSLSTSPALLVLVSAGDSPTCADGDRLVLGVEQLERDATLMRSDVRGNDCDAAWATGSWVLLPNQRS